MKTCNTCKANKVCDHTRFGFETCGSYIPNDVVEVKHGKWVINRDDYDCEYMMCSCCKEEFYPVDADTVDRTPNYCENCGADMRGKTE